MTSIGGTRDTRDLLTKSRVRRAFGVELVSPLAQQSAAEMSTRLRQPDINIALSAMYRERSGSSPAAHHQTETRRKVGTARERQSGCLWYQVIDFSTHFESMYEPTSPRIPLGFATSAPATEVTSLDSDSLGSVCVVGAQSDDGVVAAVDLGCMLFRRERATAIVRKRERETLARAVRCVTLV